jgi:hypothetical protein
MSEIELLQSCAMTVLRDVDATTRLHVTLSEWIDADNGIEAVIHEVGVQPTRPVWEAVGCLSGGDGLAVHPPVRPSEGFPEIGGSADVMVMVADAAQDLVNLLLWERASDPSWPACPEHHGAHPLRARVASDARVLRGGTATVADSVARWECPTGSTSIPIGHLGASQE